jgi:SpoVK/Ycf46/Vps4 family AAA+-type ATPase
MPELGLVREPFVLRDAEPLRIDLALDAMAGRLGRLVGGLGDQDAAEFLQADRPPWPGPQTDGVLQLPYGAAQPVDRLVSGLALTAFDRELLILALLPQRDETVAAVLRGLHPLGQPWPTVGLAALMAERGLLAEADSRVELREALDGSAVLRHGLVTLDGDNPLPECSLRPQPYLWQALTGADGWPMGVRPDVRPVPQWGFEQWRDLPAVRAASTALARQAAVTLLAVSDRSAALAARLAALVSSAGLTSVVLQIDRLDSELILQVLVLALARGLVPVVWESPGRGAAIDLTLPELPLPLAISAATASVTSWPRPLLTVPATALQQTDRETALARAVPQLSERGLVGPATIEPRDLVMAVTDVGTQLAYGDPLTLEELRRELVGTVDARTAGSVPAGAVLVHPDANWKDLVLPADQLLQLQEAAGRMRARTQVLQHWGFGSRRHGTNGLRMLFFGPPGTGKTLAAEVIASEVRRDLLVVDLSRLVSKWIGETEKNLSAVFDAAESADAAIFFDEADALFGRRTEVGDARDRYANLETAYLLFRLERFDGIAVLASNLRQNIDPAFARRIEFMVAFDPPDEEARLRLWRLHLPTAAPLDPAVSLPELAALYELPGALIRNAALAAAFLAANDRPAADPDCAITTAHLVHGIRREYAKAGLAFPGLPSGLLNNPPTGKGN